MKAIKSVMTESCRRHSGLIRPNRAQLGDRLLSQLVFVRCNNELLHELPSLESKPGSTTKVFSGQAPSKLKSDTVAGYWRYYRGIKHHSRI